MRRRDFIPYPDTEAFWLVVPADFLCAMTAFGDPEFAARERADRATQAANAAAAAKVQKLQRTPR